MPWQLIALGILGAVGIVLLVEYMLEFVVSHSSFTEDENHQKGGNSEK